MTSLPPSCPGHRFSPAIISQAVWLYHRFALSLRYVEDLPAQCLVGPRSTTICRAR
jgi:transposase-like protein